MAILELEEEINKLYDRACCATNIENLDDGIITSIRNRYRIYSKEVLNVPNPRRVNLLTTLSRIKRLISTLYIINCCSISLSMQNFLNVNTSGYPVGVFNVDGDYIGIANNQSEYLILWNGDLSNQTQGTLEAGNTSTSFKLPSTATITNVVGLRFYTYTGPANLPVFVSDNDIVVYGSTIKKGNVDGILTSTDARREWNRFLYTTQKNKVPTDTFRIITCTGYIASSDLHVFHNEDSEYAAASSNFGFYTVTGYLPKALKACFWSGRLVTQYNDILNWNELTSLFSWYCFSNGGGPWGFTPANFPSTLLSNNITQLAVGEVNAPGNAVTYFPQITATNYPILVNFQMTTNGGDMLTGAESWFLTMPKITDTFFYGRSGAVQVTSTVADTVWNNVWTALNGVVPTGPTKEIRIQGTVNVTAASLTSRNNLIAAGWSILTS